jgi:hypothetical protein
MKRLLAAVAIVLLLPVPASANPGAAKGKLPPPTVCEVDGLQVTAEGLPLFTLINFLIEQDGEIVDGWVLGQTGIGTWTVRVPERTGETTYLFVSRTRGKNGSKYDVFSSCTAS